MVCQQSHRVSGKGTPVIAIDDSGRPMAVYGGYVTIDRAHYFVHQSLMFHYGVSVNVNRNKEYGLLILTGNVEVHFSASILSSEDAHVSLYEDIKAISGGSQVWPLNMRREAANVPETRLYTGASYVINGMRDLAFNKPVAGATGIPCVICGSPKFGTEWVLRKNTNYLLIVKNSNKRSAEIHIELEFCEDNCA